MTEPSLAAPHPEPHPEHTPTRHFLGWDHPALPTAAAWLAERYASAGVLDLSNFRVVLPGTRARRRLLELLLDEAESRGLPLVPPDLVTAGALPERLHTPVLPAPHPEVEEAAWRMALKGLGPESLARLLPAPPSDGDAGPWASLATTVAGLHAQVGSEGLTFDDVAARCGGDLLYNDEERWKVLAEAQRRFRRLLHDAGLRDREGARLDALETGLQATPASEGPEGPEPTLVLVGVVDLSGVVRRFLGAWPGRVIALVHAPAELEDRFDALGAVDPERWDDAHLRIPETNLRVVTRPDEQAGAVVRHLRGLGGSRSAEEITVGVPDAEVVPHLIGALEGVGVPARYAGGRPMHRTAPYRLLEALARFLDGRSYDAMAELVRHPDLAAALRRHGVPEDDPLAAISNDYHAHHLPAVLGPGMPGGPASGERSETGTGYRRGAPSSGLFRLRDALDTLLGDAATERRALSAWADPFRRLLLALYPGDFDRNRPSDRDLLAFAGAAERVLEGFEALPRALDLDALPMHQALRLLLSRLRGDAVPPFPDEGAVELLGWLELHLDDAAELVVTGVNEPFLPESVTADPFLPQTLRTRLGLADNRRRRARDLYLLSAILASRPGTLLVAGRRDAAGNPLRPSRLLLADTPESVARRILSLLEGDAEDPGDAEDSAPAGAPDSGPPDPGPGAPPFSLPPEPFISAPGGPPDRIAVTAFRLLLADPYRYALERVLELDQVTDEARELDGMSFGNLAHTVVERWANLDGADRMSEEGIRRALSDALDTHFDERFGRRPLPALRLQREHLRARLAGYASVQAARNEEGWRIMAVEAAPAGEGVPFDVDGEPILLRGRIDRVDHHPGTGIWQLLDLKSSEQAKDPDSAHRRGRGASRRWVDLQLPLYRLLARGLRIPGTDEPLLPPDATIQTGYILLPGSEPAIALADWTGEELDEAMETAADVVRMLRENHFAWDPAATSIRPDDPLGPLVGRGVLQDDDEGDDD